MSRFFGWIVKQKESKLKFSLLIIFAVLIVFNLFLLIFDITQLIIISQNSVKFSIEFYVINIIGIVLNFGALCYYIVVMILKSRSIKSKVKKVGKK